MSRRGLRRDTIGIAAAFALLAPPCAADENWPTRPMTMIVPFAAGGTGDPLGRVLAAGLSQVLGQPVIVENVGGAASAFVYSSFVCQAVGVRSVGWGRSFFVGDAKMIALSRCARRSGICTISYCVPGY